ncbi:MAG: hypothetical protein ACXWAC_03290 [Usitatibacter sp.]
MTLRALPALALAILCAPSFAASRIVPAEPTAFEPVNLQMTVDSCAFVPSTVRVQAVGSTLKLTQQPNACFAPGEPEVVDVRLGSLAPGDYRVEVYFTGTADTPAAETLAFQVRTRPQIDIFPPPPHPLTDYTAMWWNPAESGWGLSLHQSAADALFGAWFIYDAAGQPEWYTLQSGRWTSATRWTGLIYRTTGPYFADPDYDPRRVLVLPVGAATLDFKQTPGDLGRARFTYTINGNTITKILVRAPM